MGVSAAEKATSEVFEPKRLSGTVEVHGETLGRHELISEYRVPAPIEALSIGTTDFNPSGRSYRIATLTSVDRKGRIAIDSFRNVEERLLYKSGATAPERLHELELGIGPLRHAAFPTSEWVSYADWVAVVPAEAPDTVLTYQLLEHDIPLPRPRVLSERRAEADGDISALRVVDHRILAAYGNELWSFSADYEEQEHIGNAAEGRIISVTGVSGPTQRMIDIAATDRGGVIAWEREHPHSCPSPRITRVQSRPGRPFEEPMVLHADRGEIIIAEGNEVFYRSHYGDEWRMRKSFPVKKIAAFKGKLSAFIRDDIGPNKMAFASTGGRSGTISVFEQPN